MAKEVQNGKSIKEVADRFEVHETTVVLACKENRIAVPKQSPHPCGRSRNNGFLILAELLKKDMSIARIADEFETTRRRVMQVLRAAIGCGIPGLEHRIKPKK